MPEDRRGSGPAGSRGKTSKRGAARTHAVKVANGRVEVSSKAWGKGRTPPKAEKLLAKTGAKPVAGKASVEEAKVLRGAKKPAVGLPGVEEKASRKAAKLPREAAESPVGRSKRAARKTVVAAMEMESPALEAAAEARPVGEVGAEEAFGEGVPAATAFEAAASVEAEPSTTPKAKTIRKPVKRRKRSDSVAGAAVKPLAIEAEGEGGLASLSEAVLQVAPESMAATGDGHSAQPITAAEEMGTQTVAEMDARVGESDESPSAAGMDDAAFESVTEQAMRDVGAAAQIEPGEWKSWHTGTMVSEGGVTAEAVAEATVVASDDAQAETGGEQTAAAVEEDAAEWPEVDRRRRDVPLFQRRLADPSARDRRAADAAEQDRAASSVAHGPKRDRGGDAHEGAGDSAAAKPDENAEGGPAAADAERRVENRRAADRGGSLETEFRAREQQNLFNETAVWMRKGGMALLGLNVAIVIAVIVLWRSHPSQPSDLKEMQRANAVQMAEMRRAAAASELAAYAACLGSQTARSLMLQMKTGGLEERSGAGGLRTVAATEDISPQIRFDLEKTTSMNVHVPVLFHVGVMNVGNSAALNAKVWGAVKILDVDRDPEFKYDEVALAKKSISPKDPPEKVVLYTTDAGMVVPLKEAEFQRMSAGAAYLVTYGRAVYEDISGVKHWAEFCHYITEPAGVKSHATKCAAYNGSGVLEGSEKMREPQRKPLNAALLLPEIACTVPTDEKN